MAQITTWTLWETLGFRVYGHWVAESGFWILSQFRVSGLRVYLDPNVVLVW